jgi:hypothetical protein
MTDYLFKLPLSPHVVCIARPFRKVSGIVLPQPRDGFCKLKLTL